MTIREEECDEKPKILGGDFDLINQRRIPHTSLYVTHTLWMRLPLKSTEIIKK